MKRIEKKSFYKGLKNYPVFKEDVDNKIFNVVGIPEVFPQGKSYFIILGSTQLKQGSDVLVEILDSKGNVIYHEIPVYLENSGRAISVWVYDTVAPGEAYITILGELENVPVVWKNKPNIKSTFRVHVNPNLQNDKPIKFAHSPEVTASYVDRNYLVYSEDLTVPVTYSLSSSHDSFYGTYDRNYSRYDRSAPYYITLVKDIYDPDVVIIPPEDGIPSNPWFPNQPVRDDWLGGIFEAYNIALDGAPNLSYYRGVITRAISRDTFIVSGAIQDNEFSKPMSWDTDKYNLNYTATIKFNSNITGSKTNLIAPFVEFKIKNIFNFSGKVDRVRLFKKNKSVDTTYTLLGEYSADPQELFIKSGSINQELGKFNNTSSLNDWEYSGLDGVFFGSGVHQSFEAPIVVYDYTTLNGSAKLIPKYAYTKSVADPPLYSEDARRFKFYPKNFLFDVNKNHEYTITAKYICDTSRLVINDINTGNYITNILSASLGIYVSGSGVIPDYKQGYIITGSQYIPNNLGKKVGLLTSATRKNFGEVEFNFVADYTGKANVAFVVFSGIWNIADISIKPAADPGFNADELTLYAPITSLKRDELSVFKVEFLNSNGDLCETVIETDKVILLKNQPIYVEKSDNLILGKISISKETEKGIILSGETGSLIKSNTYFGKTVAQTEGSGGFAYYSGSIFPGYNGVGFELDTGHPQSGSLYFKFDSNGERYLIISASIYALSGSNVSSASGGGGVGGLWTQSEGSASIHRVGDVQITGSLSILGNLIYVSSSILYSSGSNKFGDSLDDTHEFTGSVNITGSLNIIGQISSTENFPTASWALNVVSASKNSVSYFTSSYTWSFEHNLQEKFVNIQIYNSYDEIIIPEKIIAIDSNSADIYFNTPVAGTAVATYGGYNGPRYPRSISIGGIASQSFSAASTWSLDHNLAYQYVLVQAYDAAGYQVIPSNIKLINENKVELYFSTPVSGTAVASIGGSSIIKQATITLACSDEDTQITIKNNVMTFYMPYSMDLVNVKASLNSSGSTSTSIDIKKNNNSIFASPMIISASTYVATLVPSTIKLNEDDRISVDIISAGTGAKGLKVSLLGY